MPVELAKGKRCLVAGKRPSRLQTEALSPVCFGLGMVDGGTICCVLQAGGAGLVAPSPACFGLGMVDKGTISCVLRAEGGGWRHHLLRASGWGWWMEAPSPACFGLGMVDGGTISCVLRAGGAGPAAGCQPARRARERGAQLPTAPDAEGSISPLVFQLLKLSCFA